MPSGSPDPVIRNSAPESRWTAGIASIVLVAGISLLDLMTGWESSLSLLYLVPISTAAWFGGRRLGLAACFVAAISGAVVQFEEQPSLPTTLWNAGAEFGIFLAFCLLLDVIRGHRSDLKVIRSLQRSLAISATLACLLAIAGFFTQRILPDHSVGSVDSTSSRPATIKEASVLLARVTDEVESAMRASRPVLLGSRDPKGPSCVPVMLSGQVQGTVPASLMDIDGGPGTKLAILYFLERRICKTPVEDFNWHQNRLKTYLQNQSVDNFEAQQLAHLLAEHTRALRQIFKAWTVVPDDLEFKPPTNRGHWLSFCVDSLNASLRARDLKAAKQWTRELESAAFALEDLHRWLGFLNENHLTALEFQARCESLFQSTNSAAEKYNINANISSYPGGVLCLNGISNYFEVERQAERLFTVPDERIEALVSFDADSDVRSWRWMPPELRECFMKLRQVLSEDNQKIWDQASHGDFDHSYLVNMLYRAWTTDRAEQLSIALKRFDANHPTAIATELMGALMYRGHSFAGLEWGDRFQPELMNASSTMEGSDEEVFLEATAWTNQFYRPAQYGLALTLRDALQRKVLDCVRATDMIGSLLYDAGRTRFGHVWWSAGTSSHAVAALFGDKEGKPTARLADGMNPSDQLEVWPQAYFNSHDWPAELKTNPPPYAVELYVRGIDNYVWAEGYIIRGPNAGILTRAAVPYLPLREEKLSEKVFAGPYPE